MSNQSIKPRNRLSKETSPYLLEHAHQPVDWYPWGQEAFHKAKTEDKPVFLSIGYSTCHWCHVMARESFDDPEVARLLNESFVPIKVDKEERPDIDHVYMDVCMAMTGSGGWPLTVFLAPDQKPFFAGTYFPKRRRYGMPGLMDLLSSVRSQWNHNRPELLQHVESLMQVLSAETAPAEVVMDTPQTLIDTAIETLTASFDKEFGGFGPAPKFPMPHILLFLMEASRQTRDEGCLQMTESTLLHMRKGGIFDQIGFGFSRYSTDQQWLTPHFEKMLYDNAMLLMAYAKAYQQTQNPLYRSTAEKVIAYIAREMTHPQGGFFSAQDADSDGVEGKYYVFTPEETRSVLGEEQGSRFNHLYDISPKGNFEGHSIPNQIHLPVPDDSLTDALPLLYAYRKDRAPLRLDDKVLTAWNGLMIAALCDASLAFDSQEALSMAERACVFVERNLYQENSLFVSFREGKRTGPGLLNDYAFFILARLKLYLATLDALHLQSAETLLSTAVQEFWDEEHGGFFLYSFQGEQLVARPKETHDGALPSGNSVMAMNLVLLSQLTEHPAHKALLEKQLAFMLSAATSAPRSYAFFLLALLTKENPGPKITVVLRDESERPTLVQALRGKGLVVFRDQETATYHLKEGQTTFYVCEGFVCHPPVTSLAEALEVAPEGTT